MVPPSSTRRRRTTVSSSGKVVFCKRCADPGFPHTKKWHFDQSRYSGRYNGVSMIGPSTISRLMTPGMWKCCGWGAAVFQNCLHRLRKNQRREFEDWEAVRVVSCKKCSTELTRRGMCVSLLTNSKKKLYSTDIPLRDRVKEVGNDKVAPGCQCVVRSLCCISCNSDVGYHVTSACVFCVALEEDNGHYWLFSTLHTLGHRRKFLDGQTVTWSTLPHNDCSNLPTLFVTPPPNHLLCCICSEVMHEPTMCPCGHTFCRACILHEFDMRHKCPLDRQAIPSTSVLIPNIEIQSLVENLLIYCCYGLRRRQTATSEITTEASNCSSGSTDDEWERAPLSFSSSSSSSSFSSSSSSYSSSSSPSSSSFSSYSSSSSSFSSGDNIHCRQVIALGSREKHECACQYRDSRYKTSS